MKNLLLLVCLCAFIVVMTSCSEDTPIQVVSYLTGKITGKVYTTDEDGNFLKDMSGSKIQLIGAKTYTTTTTTDGTFTFEKVEHGIYTIIVSANDHFSQTRKSIQFIGNGTLEITEFILARKFNNSVIASISILDEKGNFIYDSTGLVLTLSNSYGFDTVVNNRMNVTIDSLPTGAMSIKVRKNGFVYDSTGLQIYRLPQPQPINLRIFKVEYNKKVIAGLPQYQFTTTLNNGVIDSTLIITVDAETSIDMEDLYFTFMNSLSDTVSFLSEFSVSKMLKKSSNQFSLSEEYKKKGGQGTWLNTKDNVRVAGNQQYFFYIRTFAELQSAEHKNNRFPKGFYKYASKIVPFTIPK